ncbi:MAG: hypothetical protein FJY51_01000 [Betaproteobacteria bacterium]|nr:hypothetical protein [Betaproteobacteria bacterium]
MRHLALCAWLAPAGAAAGQWGLRGSRRFCSGKCAVRLRDLGDLVRAVAGGWAGFCGSRGSPEPLPVGRRGNCHLPRPRR